MSAHLILLVIRAIGYAALATALVYVVLVVKEEFPPTRAKLFVVTHGAMSAFFYTMSLLSMINLNRYVHPPTTVSLLIMDYVITPTVLCGTIAAWWFSLRQTRKAVGISKIMSTPL